MKEFDFFPIFKIIFSRKMIKESILIIYIEK